MPEWEALSAKPEVKGVAKPARKPVDYEERIRTAKTEAQRESYRKMQAKQAARLAAEAVLHQPSAPLPPPPDNSRVSLIFFCRCAFGCGRTDRNEGRERKETHGKAEKGPQGKAEKGPPRAPQLAACVAAGLLLTAPFDRALRRSPGRMPCHACHAMPCHAMPCRPSPQTEIGPLPACPTCIHRNGMVACTCGRVAYKFDPILAKDYRAVNQPVRAVCPLPRAGEWLRAVLPRRRCCCRGAWLLSLSCCVPASAPRVAHLR
eukprot:SAG22_NODE_355_length_11775_cov_76.400651_2_plen_261_part_00